MERKADDDGPTLTVYENVRCLECGTVYSKPARGGTAHANPGCPDCGYVGWVSVTVPFKGERGRTHSGEDRSLDHSAQSR